jgi:hypothetical protein
MLAQRHKDGPPRDREKQSQPRHRAADAAQFPLLRGFRLKSMLFAELQWH